jgi:glycosyltransferase involved in cell wall biosynthesis
MMKMREMGAIVYHVNPHLVSANGNVLCLATQIEGITEVIQPVSPYQMLRSSPVIYYRSPNGADGKRIPYPPTVVDIHTNNVIDTLHKDRKLIIWINAPYWQQLLPEILDKAKARLGNDNVTVIYDVLDDFVGFSDLAPFADRLEDMHNKLLRDCDIITYTARRMESHSLAQHTHKAIYLPNACDPQAWNLRKRKENKPIVGYFGVIAEWFDLPTLSTIASNNQIHVEIVGPINRQIHRLVNSMPNVTYLGTKHHSELPHIATRWSCAIIPFKKTNLTDSTDPVKLYEFMAAGLPIVATDLDEIRNLSNTMSIDAKPILVKQGQQRMFSRSVKHVIKEDSEEKRQARKNWAAEHSWEARANTIAMELGLGVIA